MQLSRLLGLEARPVRQAIDFCQLPHLLRPADPAMRFVIVGKGLLPFVQHSQQMLCVVMVACARYQVGQAASPPSGNGLSSKYVSFSTLFVSLGGHTRYSSLFQFGQELQQLRRGGIPLPAA